MSPGQLAWLVWWLPAAAAVALAAVPKRRAGLAHAVAIAAMLVDTALAVRLAATVVAAGGNAVGPHRLWLDTGTFTLGIGTFVDPMGAILTAIVCGLATLVLTFNVWYMRGDALAARFPWQLCCFAFAMLGVVVADNLFLAFCCWELVGLGSYLLIGFWFDRPPAGDDPEWEARTGQAPANDAERALGPASAQLKAFVMNRVGDAGFLLGIGALLAAALLAGRTGDVLGYPELLTLPAAGGPLQQPYGQLLLALGAVGLLCGAIGKSAQFPLHTWLPDAMQGPTTASAIIHAATMVAAGVFLVARCLPLFPPSVLLAVGYVGGVTCCLAATAACVQRDLKAVLAYSTLSQLGLMFVGLAAGEDHGGRTASIAHLFTHAAFKCLLFLCAGAVMHACGTQDLGRLGGLRRRMPLTAACSLLGVLAIAGAPWFSGAFSKDAIFAATVANARDGGAAAAGPLVLAAVGSLLTAFYMLRWWLSLFGGRLRDDPAAAHAHDPPPVAASALLLLAPLTLALPFTANDWLERSLVGAADHAGAAEAAATGAHLATALAAVGAAFALALYGPVRWRAGSHADGAGAPGALRAWCRSGFGLDRLWTIVFARGLGRGWSAICARLDLGSARRQASLTGDAEPATEWSSVDGVVDGLAAGCRELGAAAARAHGGRLGVYLAMATLLAMAGLAWGLLR